MTFTSRILGAAVAALVVAAPFAQAQEITEAHLKSARAAIAAIGATDQFDNILPSLATNLKEELINKDPNLEAIVSATVDDKTLALASRRTDLENEAARAYATNFSQEELDQIATFYNSDAGKKLITEGPIVTREVLKAADIWQRGIARDLAEEVGKTLQEVAKAQAPAPAEGETPAEGEAPAEGEKPKP